MGNPREKSDSDAILARRALFVSTALAALSCGPPEGPKTELPPTSSAQASASAIASPSATSHDPVLASEPWADVLRSAPPRGISRSLKGQEREQFDWLEQSLTSQYAAVGAVWEAVPQCDAAAPDCRATWRDLGAKAKTMYDATRGGFGVGCGGAHGETASLMARRQAHATFLQKRIEQLEQHLTRVAASFSPQGEQEWRKLMANAKQPPPMPCLSPCPMPEVSAIVSSVGFAKDASAVAESDAVTAQALKTIALSHKADRKPSKIVVRGHADPSETKPSELSLARAKSVADLLIKAGVPKADVEVLGFGDELPVGRSDTADGAAANRRVDFEAVPAAAEKGR